MLTSTASGQGVVNLRLDVRELTTNSFVLQPHVPWEPRLRDGTPPMLARIRERATVCQVVELFPRSLSRRAGLSNSLPATHWMISLLHNAARFAVHEATFVEMR